MPPSPERHYALKNSLLSGMKVGKKNIPTHREEDVEGGEDALEDDIDLTHVYRRKTATVNTVK